MPSLDSRTHCEITQRVFHGSHAGPGCQGTPCSRRQAIGTTHAIGGTAIVQPLIFKANRRDDGVTSWNPTIG
jgi:hypothetical protein